MGCLSRAVCIVVISQFVVPLPSVLGREYFLGAVEVDWDYAPSGRDLVQLNQSRSYLYFGASSRNNSHVHKKTVYREFTDGNFTTRRPRLDHLGILGPILYVNVGERLTVHFKNMATRPHSLHISRLTYTKSYEGSNYEDTTEPIERLDNSVAPNSTFVYVYNVTADVGPDLDGPRCVSSLYYSDSDAVRDINSGLIGNIVICRAEEFQRSQNKKIVNLVFGTFDEDQSWHADENRNMTSGENSVPGSNIMHSINGYVFGNMPVLEFCIDDNVYLFVSGIGENKDVQSVRISGHTFIHRGKRKYALPVSPGSTERGEFTPIEPGRWLLTSQTERLSQGGMVALVDVKECNRRPLNIQVGEGVRRYFLAIEDIADDNGMYSYTGFVRYADIRFNQKVTRPADENHLGKLGPLLVAEVGQTIKVVVKNNARQSYTVHAHGVRTHKRNEGANYNDTTNQQAIESGSYRTYYWTVPQSYAPTMANLPCQPSYYTSFVDPFEDAKVGLIGPMLICQEGLMLENEEKPNSWRDIFLFHFSRDASGAGMSGVNGLIDFPTINLTLSEDVKVHIMDLGSGDKISSLSITGNPFEVDGAVQFSIGLYPGLISSADIELTKPGYWSMTFGPHSNVVVPYHVDTGGIIVHAEDFSSYTTTMYIGIQEEEWDYTNGRTETEEWQRSQMSSVKTGPRYKKAIFKESYSEFFAFWKSKGTTQGLLGPTIRVVSGQNIRLVISNSGTRPYSIYSPGIPIKREDAGEEESNLHVQSGAIGTFIWNISPTSGPGEGDPDCIMRAYYSNVDPQKDISSGLLGPLIICRNEEALQTDQDNYRENKNNHIFIGEIQESQSWYLSENLPPGGQVNANDVNFLQDNTVYVINGFAKGSVPKLTSNKNIDLHVYNFGSLFHTLHFHGATFLQTDKNHAKNTNILPMFPGERNFVRLRYDFPGEWKYGGLGADDQLNELFGFVSDSIGQGPSK